MELYTDEYFMQQAYKQALKALEEGEVPIGAVVVAQDRIISRAYNQTETLSDTTAHAEMLAITAASSYLGNKYLKDCTLYVTMEPCVMCEYGFMKYGKGLLHPKTKLEFGILSVECGALVTDFFKTKRKLKVN